jgi:hypothetical protein
MNSVWSAGAALVVLLKNYLRGRYCVNKGLGRELDQSAHLQRINCVFSAVSVLSQLPRLRFSTTCYWVERTAISTSLSVTAFGAPSTRAMIWPCVSSTNTNALALSRGICKALSRRDSLKIQVCSW